MISHHFVVVFVLCQGHSGTKAIISQPQPVLQVEKGVRIVNLGQEMPELAVALDHDRLASFSRVMSIHKSSFNKVYSKLLDPHCMHGDYIERSDRKL